MNVPHCLVHILTKCIASTSIERAYLNAQDNTPLNDHPTNANKPWKITLRYHYLLQVFYHRHLKENYFTLQELPFDVILALSEFLWKEKLRGKKEIMYWCTKNEDFGCTKYFLTDSH